MILMFVGCILVFLGAVKLMIDTKLGPPPGPLAFVFVLIIGMFKTKIGMIGLGCIILGSILGI